MKTAILNFAKSLFLFGSIDSWGFYLLSTVRSIILFLFFSLKLSLCFSSSTYYMEKRVHLIHQVVVCVLDLDLERILYPSWLLLLFTNWPIMIPSNFSPKWRWRQYICTYPSCLLLLWFVWVTILEGKSCKIAKMICMKTWQS